MSPPITPRWQQTRDSNGYATTLDGRWKAKEHPASGHVTLVDTTDRALFGDNGNLPWIRRPDWPAVEETIAAHYR